MFSGDRVIAYFFLESPLKQEIQVKLTAKMGPKDLEQIVTVNPSTLEKGDFYHKLGAKKLIKYLISY